MSEALDVVQARHDERVWPGSTRTACCTAEGLLHTPVGLLGPGMVAHNDCRDLTLQLKELTLWINRAGGQRQDMALDAPAARRSIRSSWLLLPDIAAASCQPID
jgi:hypothetical protein